MPGSPEKSPEPARAGRHRASVILFVVLTAAVLGADLLVKSLAFKHVAAFPDNQK